jgi:parallel beta-helix repeat protein
MCNSLKNASRIFGLAIIVGAMASPLIARDYYVAQTAANASDENAGTEAAPWKTINRSLQGLTAGDTVHVGGGVYREQIILPGEAWNFGGVTYPKTPGGAGFGQMISFVGESRDKVIIKGSDVVTNWTPHRDAIWVCDWPYNSQQVFCDSKPLTQIGGKMWKYLDEDVPFSPTLMKPKWLGRKGRSLEDIEAGSFYVDLDAKKLYVWMADGSDPSKHVIEAGVRSFGVCLYATQYIKVANLSIQHANTSPASNWGGLNVDGTGHLIENVDSCWNDVAGLHLQGKDHAIVNSTFDHNGNTGITGATSRTRILNCQTNYNNRRRWERDWGSGGIKLIPNCKEVVISGHTAAYNHGPGIWFDSWNTLITIENSRIHNNSGMGIFYEVSERAVISNNVVYDNTHRGIYVSNSSNCLIAHNMVYGNGMSGIVIAGVNRSAPPLFGHPDTGAIFCNNNYVYGNIFMDNCHPDRCPRGMDGEGRSWILRPELILPDPEMPSNQNNVSDHNVFYRSGDRLMSFWAGWGKAKPVIAQPGDSSTSSRSIVQTTPAPASQALDAWQKATGQDAHSIVEQPLFVSVEERDFRPMENSPIFIVPGLPSVRSDAMGKAFAKRKATSKDARGSLEVGLTDAAAAAGPYAGQ